jgi:D-alanyl-D-alanine dipeptidase
LKAKVYVRSAILRLKTVAALVEANKEFIKKGYRIKFLSPFRYSKECGNRFEPQVCC